MGFNGRTRTCMIDHIIAYTVTQIYHRLQLIWLLERGDRQYWQTDRSRIITSTAENPAGTEKAMHAGWLIEGEANVVNNVEAFAKKDGHKSEAIFPTSKLLCMSCITFLNEQDSLYDWVSWALADLLISAQNDGNTYTCTSTQVNQLWPP